MSVPVTPMRKRKAVIWLTVPWKHYSVSLNGGVYKNVHAGWAIWIFQLNSLKLSPTQRSGQLLFLFSLSVYCTKLIYQEVYLKTNCGVKKAKGQPDSQLKASMKAARLKFSSPTAWLHREGREGCHVYVFFFRATYTRVLIIAHVALLFLFCRCQLLASASCEDGEWR